MSVYNECVVLKKANFERNKFGEKICVGLLSVGEVWAKVFSFQGKTFINLLDVDFSRQFSHVGWKDVHWKVVSKMYDPIDKVMRVEIEIKEGCDGGNH